MARAATTDNAGPRLRRRNRGASFVFFVVGLLLAAATVYAVRLLLPAGRGAAQASVTAANMETIRGALIAYAAVNGRLPCPADPTLAGSASDGKAVPETATTTCGVPAGIVPWSTLGLAPEVILDGWNRRIDYRVFDGPTGLTQANGASMVDCDTLVPYGAAPLAANGQCSAAHTNQDAQFLAAKGLTVNAAGTSATQVAWVLVSHGESGQGAWLASGAQLALPAAGGDAAVNLQAPTPPHAYYQDPHSPPGTDPASNAYFADIVTWTGIAELARASGLAARDWPDAPKMQLTLTTMTNMTSAGPDHFNAANGGQPFAATTSTNAAGIAVDTLAFGGGGTAFANCAWWPTPFTTFNGSDRLALRLYLQFSTDIASTPFAGFTLGFLSQRVTDAFSNSTPQPLPFTGLCGDTATPGNLGWGNGSSGVLQAPRFAVEFDARQDVASNDPAPNHLAVDFSDVVHDGSKAAACSATPQSYDASGSGNDCYTGTDAGWLRNGLAVFHGLRLEIVPRDPACSGGTAPHLHAWLLPNSVCPDGSTDATCIAAQDLTQPFTATAGAIVVIDRCIAPPTSTPGALATDFDQLYFGITAGNDSATGTVLQMRNLNAAAFYMNTP